MEGRKEIYEPKRVFQVCPEIAQEVETKKRRTGRPPVYKDRLYLALLLFKSYFNLTFRAVIPFYQSLFPHEPCPSFQSLHWFLSKKLAQEGIEDLFGRLKERLYLLLPKGEELFVLDTTGIPHRGKTQKLKWMRGEFYKKMKGHSRLCVLIRYLLKARLLILEGIKVGDGYASDVKLGVEVLKGASSSGLLLADAGFDSQEIYEEAKKKGLVLTMRLKGGGEVRGQWRKEMEGKFDPFLYRLRGIAEGLFGGIKTKMNGALRSLRAEVSGKKALLEAVCYNLRIYLSLLFLPLLPLHLLLIEELEELLDKPS